MKDNLTNPEIQMILKIINHANVEELRAIEDICLEKRLKMQEETRTHFKSTLQE